MPAFFQKIAPKRPLYVQLLFTALAFLAMVVFGYLFTSDIVHKHLIQNAHSVLTSTETHIYSEIMEPKVSISVFSRALRRMLYDGDDIAKIKDYITDTSDYLLEQQLSSFEGIFFCVDSIPDSPFINSIGWEPPSGYIISEQPWYLHTKEAVGGIAETLSYPDIISGEAVNILSRCIHDDDDVHLAVVGLRMRLDTIARSVVNTALAQGGFGVLLSEDLLVLAHPNSDFVNKNLRDSGSPAAAFADDLLAGKEISEEPVMSYMGEPSIAFFRKLSNGWYLGLVTPKGPYFQSVTRMVYFLGILGFALAMVLIIILLRIDAAKIKSDKESKHKSVFLANMSHEIRTPMNAIIGMTNLGRSAVDIERKDYCFNKIHDASNHLLGVINDILDMSKIEANKFDLSPEEFNFEKMLQRVVNVVGFRIDEKHQKFNVHIDYAIPKILVADDHRLSQIIANLLGNAVKFTPEHGSISLDARYIGESRGVCTIQISVSDTGIGISPEQQKRLFDSFEQAESSTTRKYGGTGLGLSISKSIVEMMGGKIWIESELGKGATFIFTIQAKYGSRKGQGLLSANVNWSNIRIMVVDDDPDVLKYFTEIAESFDIFCDTASSGEEALNLVKQNSIYHIYFIDWKMPGMDGIQLAGELKMHSQENSVIIMITAAEWTTIADHAKQAGVDKFLSKPLFPTMIADAIKESLGFDTEPAEKAQEDITGIFAGKRILLVEDVEINREIVLALLEPAQLEIDCAENGADAVRKYSEAPNKYEMIFMDVQMPEMDGYEATRRIRALKTPNAKTIPIIAMTANVFREDIEKCLEAGMDSHLGKPLDFEEVLDKMRMFLLPPEGGKA